MQFSRKVKFALLCFSFALMGLSACTTLENRRDMYCGSDKVMGPYTRMLEDGIPKPGRTVLIPVTVDYKSSGGK